MGIYISGGTFGVMDIVRNRNFSVKLNLNLAFHQLGTIISTKEGECQQVFKISIIESF